MATLTEETEDKLLTLVPDQRVTVREALGVDSDMIVPRFSQRDPHVPDIDDAYRFDPETTLAICAGLAYDRRVMIQGYHGTGKSTHIEQVAARLNWPMIRVNLDSHVSRIDLVGKDAIVLKDDRVLADQIDAADVAVEVDADHRPVEARGDLLDVRRLAGAVIALDHHAAIERQAGADGERGLRVEAI